MGCLKLTYYQEKPTVVVLKNTSFRSYRYGFNGMEKDDEVSGSGNSYTAEFWQYSPRLGRRFNIDPMAPNYPWQSPYATYNNNPIYFIDPYGLEGTNPNDIKETGGGTDKDHTTGFGGTDRGTADNPVELPTAEIFPDGGGSGGGSSWTSETNEFAYGGTIEQYEKEYGLSNSKIDNELWNYIYSDKFNEYKASEIQKAKDKAVIDKLGFFVSGAEILSTVIGPVTGLNAYQSLGKPKSFNYSPRSTNYLPPNDGFVNGQFIDELLESGTMLDRYGSDFGRYLSPQGTPFNMRALPNSYAKRPLSIFKVTKPFPVQSGKIAPAFGKYGLGTQYKTVDNVKTLLDGGFLERVK